MEPYEYVRDSGWKDLANQLAMAEKRLREAEITVRQHDCSDGRKAALKEAKEQFAKAQDALAAREATLSDPKNARRERVPV